MQAERLWYRKRGEFAEQTATLPAVPLYRNSAQKYLLCFANY
jgi:hypothetical protein